MACLVIWTNLNLHSLQRLVCLSLSFWSLMWGKALLQPASIRIFNICLRMLEGRVLNDNSQTNIDNLAAYFTILGCPTSIVNHIVSEAYSFLVICCWCSVSKSCLTLCDPMDYSMQASFVHKIIQAGILLI